jgi:peptidoglycan hydrolase-like protein with peptidoglycan-binding domain
MKKAAVFLLLLTLPLAGCAMFESKGVKSLDKRVSSVEDRQTVLEDRLAGDEATGYTTNIEPKRTSSAAPSQAKVTLSKKEIQTALKNAGYYYGAIDGKLGKQSMRAIKEFQEENGLKVDGVVGAQTTKKLLPHLAGEEVK